MNLAYVSDYLRTYRLYKKLSVPKLSHATGIHRETLRGFEYSKAITLSNINILCSHYGLFLSTVFEFMEIAEQNGIESAYESEAPNLIQFRKPIGLKK